MDIQTRVISSIVVLVGSIVPAVVPRRLGLVKERQGAAIFNAGQSDRSADVDIHLPGQIGAAQGIRVVGATHGGGGGGSPGLASLGRRRLRLLPPRPGLGLLVAGFASSLLPGHALVSFRESLGLGRRTPFRGR